MLIVDLFLDKHYIGIATFINMFLTGYIADYSQAVIGRTFPSPSMAGRIIMLIIGVVLMCFASSLYMTFRFCRIGCDLICVIIGALCGLLPGVGTLITAFFMGPLIEFFNIHFSRPVLYGKEYAAKSSK